MNNNNNLNESNLQTEVFTTEAALNTQQGESLDTNEPDPLKLRLEEKIINSTRSFFRSLKINLIFLIYFNSMGILSILGIMPFKYGVLSFVPLEIVLIFYQYSRVKKKVRGKSRKKIIGKLLVSSEFLDSLSRCFSSALFFLAHVIKSFTFSLCFGPIALCSLVVIVVNVVKCCKVRLNY